MHAQQNAKNTPQKVIFIIFYARLFIYAKSTNNTVNARRIRYDLCGKSNHVRRLHYAF